MKQEPRPRAQLRRRFLDRVPRRIKREFKKSLGRFVWILRRTWERDFIAVFNFHRVYEASELPWNLPGSSGSRDSFDRQLAILSRKFDVVPLWDAIMGTVTRHTKPLAAITFDDGDESVANVAHEMLLQRNLPATFFVNGRYLAENSMGWCQIAQYVEKARIHFDPMKATSSRRIRTTLDVDYYRECTERIEASRHALPFTACLKKRFVTLEFLRGLDENFFHVGSHGWQHHRFSMFSRQEQKVMIERDLELLRPLKAFRPLFATPFGRPIDWNADTELVSQELGLRLVLSDGGLHKLSQPHVARIAADGCPLLRALYLQIR